MRKLLLFTSLLFGSFFTVTAQDDCAEAVLVVSGETYTVDAVDGTFPSGGVVCTFADGNAATPAAEWYYFIAPSSGLMTINAGLEANTPADNTAFDTRLRVLSGTCGTFTCVGQNDDISYPADLRSRLVNVPIVEGVTYYIVFDNRWSATTFDFEFTFTEATCFPVVGGFAFEADPTPTAASISWSPPTLGTPVGYTVEYGVTGFELGSGSTIEVDEPMVEFTDLTPATEYQFYIMTDCGEEGTSAWVGPVSFATPYDAITELPYEFGFEADPLGYNGGWLYPVADDDNSWFTLTEIPEIGLAPYEGDIFVVAAGLLDVSTDIWLFSRPIDLENGQQIEISYYLAKFAGAGAGGVNNLDVTIGTDTTAEAQTNVLQTLSDYANEEYTLQSTTFTATAAGTYYIGFNYTTPAQTEEDNGALLLDAFKIDTAAGVEDFADSGFSVTPNPTSAYLNITNPENILIREVEITDINGRVVNHQKYDNAGDILINVGDIAAGMYVMKVTSDKGTFVKKIIKN